MKKLFILLSFLLGACGNGIVSTAQAQVIARHTEYPAFTPTFAPTRTPVPSATIDYEATIWVSQATADEARRANAEATAAHEVYLLAQMQLTEGADKRNQEILSWTATAAGTVIPLTATRQVALSTEVAAQQSLVAGILTSTHEAPTQMAAMLRAQETARYVALSNIIDLIAKIALSVFAIGIVAFMFRFPVQPKVEPEEEEEPQIETVVHMRRDNGQGAFSQQRLVVPCSDEQLTELAELAINGEKKFGINRLETNSRTFKSQRETLLAVRQFLFDNKLVIADAKGTITLNAEGEAFLSGWFESHQLPDNYEFEEMEKEENDRLYS